MFHRFLITPERIALISYQPSAALPAAGSSYSSSMNLQSPGCAFDQSDLRFFWPVMANLYYFVSAFGRARAVLLQGLDTDHLSKDLAALEGMAASLRDQVGSFYGTTVAAKYLILPILAGNEPGTVRMQFSRGSATIDV